MRVAVCPAGSHVASRRALGPAWPSAHSAPCLTAGLPCAAGRERCSSGRAGTTAALGAEQGELLSHPPKGEQGVGLAMKLGCCRSAARRGCAGPVAR